jgi:hypothetical protein
MKLNELVDQLELARGCALVAKDRMSADAIREAVDILSELPTTEDGEAIIPDAPYYLAGGRRYKPSLMMAGPLWASEAEARKQ